MFLPALSDELWLPQQRTSISYYTPILIQCTLPRSDPKVRDWKKANGDYSLIISSGVDENLQPYGIPYGSFPRLVLAYIITRVIQTGETRIQLGPHFSTFLEEVGYTGNHAGNGTKGRRVRDHLMRLIMARITFQGREWSGEAVGRVGANIEITTEYSLWWDFKNPEQGTLLASYIDISEKFGDAILRAPVPLSTEILAALKKSPLALDVYMWVSYRLFTMQVSK